LEAVLRLKDGDFMSKVICLGISVVDVMAKPVNQVPEKGKLSLVDSINLHTGGCAVNTAIDLIKLGEEAGIIGLVGNDGFGSFLIDALKSEGVSTEGLAVKKGVNTSASVVLSNSDGERSFIHCYGANSELCEQDVDFNIIKQSEILFVAGSLLMPKLDGIPTANILRKAKELGKFTVLDTAWDPTGRWMKAIGPCLPYVDLFIPSLEEAAMLSAKDNEKEIAKDFIEKGAGNVVIKLGEKGCYINSEGFEGYISAYSVKALDTNGAGDSFVAGFITGLLNKWSFEKCGIFANAVGAHCVQAVGASTGIKNKDEILHFIHEMEK
jgi:sugar/nucleoside kinase (ribokinase family)